MMLGGLGHMGAVLPEERSKRRRRADDDLGHGGLNAGMPGLNMGLHMGGLALGGTGGMGVMGPGAGGNMASGLMSPRAMRDVLMREVSRMDAIRATIGDPTSPDYAVAQRAYSRLRTIVSDLDVPADAVPGIIDMARQVADILLMMKGEDEPACDFQVRA
jgi:hypothetical protein